MVAIPYQAHRQSWLSETGNGLIHKKRSGSHLAEQMWMLSDLMRHAGVGGGHRCRVTRSIRAPVCVCWLRLGTPAVEGSGGGGEANSRWKPVCAC